jgi:hypothetical protein
MRVLTNILDALVFVLAILLLCPQLLAETARVSGCPGRQGNE